MLCLERYHGQEIDISGEVIRVVRIDSHQIRTATVEVINGQVNGTVTLRAGEKRHLLAVGDRFTLQTNDGPAEIMLTKHYGNKVEIGIDAAREIPVRRTETPRQAKWRVGGREV